MNTTVSTMFGRTKSGDEAYLKDLVSQGEDLTIVGIVQPSEESDIAMLSTGIGYLPSLTEHVILEASDSEIVKNSFRIETSMFLPERNSGTGWRKTSSI